MTHLDTIKTRCEASPELVPYVTAKGGVVIFNGPFPIKKARAAKEFIAHARHDMLLLVAEVERLRAAMQKLRGDDDQN